MGGSALTTDGYLIIDNDMNRHSILGFMVLLAHEILRVPRKPLVPLEALHSRIPVANRLSRNQIYVCRRTQPAQS